MAKITARRAKGAGHRTKGRFLSFSLCAVLFACVVTSSPLAAAEDRKPPLQFSRNQEIRQIKPRKPARIKLHRNAKGEYQWDITGDNADEIVRADSRLRKLLKVE